MHCFWLGMARAIDLAISEPSWEVAKYFPQHFQFPIHVGNVRSLCMYECTTHIPRLEEWTELDFMIKISI